MQVIHSLVMDAVLRAGGVSILALAVAFPLRDFLLASDSHQLRRVGWALMLAPWLAPTLLLGYTYMPLALALVRHPGWKEVIYDLALWLRLTPLAACILCFAPPALTARALHCYRSLPIKPSFWSQIIFRIRGVGRGPWAALALVFLLVFGEFELASLWTIKTWSVALFDWQAGGVSIGESLFKARWPLACEAAVMSVGVIALSQRDGLGNSLQHLSIAVGQTKQIIVFCYCVITASFTLIGPFIRLLPDAWSGLNALIGNTGLAHDIVFSLLLAISATLAAWLGTSEIMRRGALVGVFVVPGLFGALLLSLLTLAFFQLPVLRLAYGTPIPLLVDLTFLLLPFAFLLRGLLRRQRRGTALHLAKQIGNHRLCWELETHKTFWAGFIIFCWAYFDLTAASLLSPPGMTTVSVRLYNLIHYGRSPALAAMLCTAIATPAIGAGLAVIAARNWKWQGSRLAHLCKGTQH